MNLPTDNEINNVSKPIWSRHQSHPMILSLIIIQTPSYSHNLRHTIHYWFGKWWTRINLDEDKNKAVSLYIELTNSYSHTNDTILNLSTHVHNILGQDLNPKFMNIYTPCALNMPSKSQLKCEIPIDGRIICRLYLVNFREGDGENWIPCLIMP